MRNRVFLLLIAILLLSLTAASKTAAQESLGQEKKKAALSSYSLLFNSRGSTHTLYNQLFRQLGGTIYAPVSTEPLESQCMPPIDIEPSDDCYVSSKHETVCHCTDQDHMFVGFNDYYDKEQTRSYVKFGSLPPKPEPEYVVRSAELLMYFYAWQGTDPFQTDIYRVTATWSEATCPTWNTRPPTDTTIRASTLITKVEAWNSWNLTSLVQDWYEGVDNYGVELRAANEDQYGGTFHTREHISDGPILRIVFCEPVKVYLPLIVRNSPPS